MPQRIVVENIADHPGEATYVVGEGETLYYLAYGQINGEKRVSIQLTGRGAEAYLYGALFGTARSGSLITLQDHRAPDTKSDLLVRCVLGEKAFFNYHGSICIARDAQRSNAYQRNENILLSRTARVDTKPALEILANDVRCTHGATVGKLDEESIFYLRSRGLTRPEAAQLMLQGFLAHVVSLIPDTTGGSEINDQMQLELVTVI